MSGCLIFALLMFVLGFVLGLAWYNRRIWAGAYDTMHRTANGALQTANGALQSANGALQTTNGNYTTYNV